MLAKNILLKLNKCFKAPVHPFNLRNDGKKSYAEWQYEKGEDTIKFYLKKYTKEEMFNGKKVLDIGCGAGGKSLYYTTLGAEVVGVDVVAAYEMESTDLMQKLAIDESKFKFLLADAKSLPFEDGSFDSIILNDAFEHVGEPALVLKECMRLLASGGKLFINFPPYNHPFGAHLSDVIHIPWVHLFFSDKTLISAYEELVKPLKDGKERMKFRIATDKNGKKYFSYINKMTIKRAKKIVKEVGFTPVYYKEEPLRNILSPLAKLPVLKEVFVKMVVMVFEKS